MKKFNVYIHKRNDTNLVFYVGKGSGKRAYKSFNRSQHWKNIANKYGYSVEIVSDNLLESEAFELESFLISEYKNSGIILCNMTSGGEGCSGRVCTPETRKKLSDFNKGKRIPEEVKLKIGKSNIGKKMSEEALQNYKKSRIYTKLTENQKYNLSIKNKGKKLSEETKRKISQSNKGVPKSQKTREAMIGSRGGKKLSKEHREKLSKAHKGLSHSKETREKIRIKLSGRKWSQASIEKLKATLLRNKILKNMKEDIDNNI